MDVWRPFRKTLPRSFRDLHFCFRESKFKTAASASFRGVDFFTIFLEVLPRSHGELPRKLFLGVAWKCVICICWWAGHSDNVFGCTGWRVKNTYYIKVIQSNTFRFRTSQMAHTCDILGWVNHFSWSYLPYGWARGLSMPPRERFASAKLPQRTWTLLPKTYQDHGHLVFTTAHVKHIAILRSMQIRYLCMMRIWNVKDKITNPAKHTSAKLQH